MRIRPRDDSVHISTPPSLGLYARRLLLHVRDLTESCAGHIGCKSQTSRRSTLLDDATRMSVAAAEHMWRMTRPPCSRCCYPTSRNKAGLASLMAHCLISGAKHASCRACEPEFTNRPTAQPRPWRSMVMREEKEHGAIALGKWPASMGPPPRPDAAMASVLARRPTDASRPFVLARCPVCTVESDRSTMSTMRACVSRATHTHTHMRPGR